jgi:hypothetical protein
MRYADWLQYQKREPGNGLSLASPGFLWESTTTALFVAFFSMFDNNHVSLYTLVDNSAIRNFWRIFHYIQHSGSLSALPFYTAVNVFFIGQVIQ